MIQYIENSMKVLNEPDNNSFDMGSSKDNERMLGINSNATYSTEFNNNINLPNENFSKFITQQLLH